MFCDLKSRVLMDGLLNMINYLKTLIIFLLDCHVSTSSKEAIKESSTDKFEFNGVMQTASLFFVGFGALNIKFNRLVFSNQ